jgi:hypothetical protein
MSNDFSRRTILQMLAVGAVGSLGANMNDAVAQSQPIAIPSAPANNAISNRISVAQWSFHRMLKSGELAPLDFASFAHKNCGVMGVEYVKTFYRSLPMDGSWVAELKKRADDIGVTSVLIMCDGEGDIGDPDVAVTGDLDKGPPLMRN